MNNKGEIINTDEITKSCRVFNPNETLAQLQINRAKYLCWGATAFRIDNRIKARMLGFKVNGMKHKRLVYIFLNGADLYDVYLTTIKGRITDKSGDMGLYFDQLTDWIDDRIEKQDNYRF
jgi:hypothetical protein